MLHLLPHRPQAPERSLSLVAPPSQALCARPQDHGGMWPALATRCRRALPAELQWAAPLLDPRSPTPVLCAHVQARALYRWLDRQPNTQRVSIACKGRPA